MADRCWIPAEGSLEVGVVELFCNVTIGGTGAVSASSGKGFGTVTRTSAGLYSFPLSDRYNSLLWGDVMVLHTSDDNPATVGVTARFKAEQVNNASPLFTVQFYATDDGAAVDPVSGAIVYVAVKLKNSTV